MKHLFAILLITFSVQIAHAQYRFSKTYDFDTLWQIGENIVELDDGYVIFSTGGVADSLYTTGVEVIKIGFDGTLIWKKTFASSGKDMMAEYSNNHTTSLDGNIIQPGTSNIYDPEYDMFLLKIDPATGESIYFKNIYKPGAQFMHNIFEFGNGDIVISYDNFNPPYHEIRFMKVNAGGDILWDTVYGIDPQVWNGIFNVNSAHQIVSTSIFANCLPEKYYCRIIDTSGALISQTYNDSSILALVPCPYGGYFGLGQDSESPIQSYICRVDAGMNMPWSYSTGYDTLGMVDPEGQITFSGLLALQDSTVVSLGYFESTEVNGSRMMLQKHTIDGQLVWERFYDADTIIYDSMPWDIIHTSDNGFLCTGSGFGLPLDENGMYSQNIWVIKLDSVGCLHPHCDSLDHIIPIADIAAPGIGSLTISPNPVHTEAMITLQFDHYFPDGNTFTCIVTDISGHTVQQKVLNFSSIGNNIYQLPFHTSGLPGGIYFLKIISGENISGVVKVLVE